MDEKNCWADKTPLEMGLLLILSVAIPFLIILLLIYIFLPILCVNCSVDCPKFCRSKNPRLSSLPPLDNGNAVRLESTMDVCPNQERSLISGVDYNIDNTFIASITEKVYEDDFSRQRFLCAGAIVTYKWVITGSICFKIEKENRNYKNRIFVRAGSKFWSKDGSVHEVKQILFANNNTRMTTIAAINLKKEFPKLLSITPIPLSSKMAFRESFDLFDMYNWKTNDSLSIPLIFRKKYVPLTKQQLIALGEYQCNAYTKKTELFCVSPHTEEMCSNYSYMSFPVTKGNILLGINVGKICDIHNDITVHLIFDTTYVLSWLKKII